MKKIYTKPVILFENFALSTHIAGSCEVKIDGPSSGNCGFQPEGYDAMIFITDVSGCAEKHDNGYHDGLCYHVPTEAYNLFNS